MRGGMLRNITMAMHAIAAAVTAIVIAGQLLRRRSLAAMQPYFSFSQLLPVGPRATPKGTIPVPALRGAWTGVRGRERNALFCAAYVR
jgi:hypothetical protein